MIPSDELKEDNATFLVLGAGAWGLALANTLAKKNPKVYLWDKDSQLLNYLDKNRKHPVFCPNIELHKNIQINFDLSEQKYNALFFVTPFQALGTVSQLIQLKRITADYYICASKGISKNNLQLAHQILEPLLNKGSSFVQLSGPSFALEVMKGLPTAVTVGSQGREIGSFMGKHVHQESFRTYLTNDFIGVEIGGALKNVIAIAVGIADGLQLGSNARAALIVRGLGEIRLFGISRGSNPTTFSGLSGLGDLVLTATDDQSRNRQFGLKIAEHNNVSEALDSVGKLVEGYQTLQALDQSDEIDLKNYPIISEIIQILFNGRKPVQALERLLSRELRRE